MAAAFPTLGQFLQEGKAGNPTVLQAYVHRHGHDQTSYLIGDATTVAMMAFSENPSFGKNAKIGSFVKLINPNLVGRTIVPTGPVLQARPIKYRALNKSDIPADLMDGPSTSRVDLTFDDINKLPSGSNVTNFVSKITHLTPTKKASGGSGSPYKTAKVRDVRGQRHVIQLWGGHSEGVEEDKVYSFQATKVGNFKPSDASPYWLSTKPNSTIREANAETARQFDGIVEWEGTFEGFVFGHETTLTLLCRLSELLQIRSRGRCHLPE